MDQATLREILEYSPETGAFKWIKTLKRNWMGKIAGNIHKKKGYIYIQINGKNYSAHRLAWIYSKGVDSKKQIDHIDGNKTNNRIENLREATNGQNRANSKTSNINGLKGVRKLKWIKDVGKCWAAQITINKKTIYLGTFYSAHEAHLAYCDAAKKFHGDFFRP